MIMKDGTIVPVYFVDNLFLLPYLLPISTQSDSYTGYNMVDECDALASAFSMSDTNNSNMPEEAVVHLASTAIPSNNIIIDTDISDKSGPLDAATRSLIAHRAFGHVSAKKMHDTARVADGVPTPSACPTWCTSCTKGKMHVLPHSRNAWVERAKHPHDAWHIDLIGKFRSPSLGGNLYIVTIIDNYSRYVTCIPIKNKSSATVLEALKKCMAELQSKPKKIFTDWGTEFSGLFKEYCDNNMIKMEKSCPYRAYINGLVERANRSVTNVAKTLMQQSNLPVQFWAHSICTAAYISNRLSHRRLPEGITPHEAIFGVRPNNKNLRVFGCHAEILIEKEYRRKDLTDPCSDSAIFIGYCRQSTGYLFYIPGKHSIVSRRDRSANRPSE